jgi:hypothetical protein
METTKSGQTQSSLRKEIIELRLLLEKKSLEIKQEKKTTNKLEEEGTLKYKQIDLVSKEIEQLHQKYERCVYIRLIRANSNLSLLIMNPC